MKNKLLLVIALVCAAMNDSFCQYDDAYYRAEDERLQAESYQSRRKYVIWMIDIFTNKSLLLKRFSPFYDVSLRPLENLSLDLLQAEYQEVSLNYLCLAEWLEEIRDRAFKAACVAGLAGAVIGSCLASYYWVTKQDVKRKKLLKLFAAGLNGAIFSATLSYASIITYIDLKMWFKQRYMVMNK